MAINLGELNFGLGADTRRLEAARSAILAFGRSVNAAARSQAEGARAVEAALRKQEQAMVNALNTTLRLNDAVRRSGGSERHVNDLSAAYRKMVREMSAGTQTALQFQRSQEDFATTVNRVQRAVRDEQKAISDLNKQLKAAEATAVQSFNAQQREIQKAQRAAEQAAKAQQAAALTQGRAFFQAERAVESYNRAISRLPKAPQGLGMQAAGHYDAFKAAYSAAPNMLGQQKATQNFQRAMAALNAEMDKFKGKEKVIHPLEASLRRLADVSVLIQGPMSGLATRLSLIASVADNVSVKTAAMVVGLSAGAAAFTMMAKSTITTAKEIERATMALDSINGNMTITQIQLQDMMRLSDMTGTSFISLSQSYARFQAAAAGTAMEGEAARKIFEQMTFVSAKLGLSVADTEGVFRALEQIMSKGTVQAEELRGQLGDRLPGAFNLMAKALGVTTQKLGEMMKKGEVTSAALVKFADTAAERLGVDLTQPIDNIVAAENRLGNAFTRMNMILDESIGFSEAYKNVLNGLTATMDFVANNLSSVLGGLGGVIGGVVGAMAAIYAPAIIAGFANLITIVRSLTASMIALTAASLSNPFGALAQVLVRLGAAAAGAVVGFELLSSAVSNTAGAHFGAIPGVKAYIAAQQDLKYSIRDTTNEFIKQQEVFLQGLKNQAQAVHRNIQQAEHTLFDETGGWMRNPLTGQAMRDEEGIRQAAEALPKYEAELRSLSTQIMGATMDHQKLQDILKKQTAIENERTTALGKMTGASTKAAKGTDELKNALDGAYDSIRETEQALAIQGLPKYMQEWARVQMDINKSVDTFRDKLVQAGAPLQTVNTLTARYAALTRQLKEGEYYIKTHTTAWEAFAGVMSRGMDTAMNNFVDGMLEGQNMMETLRTTAKAVVADMIKTFMQLSVINPLKNALFGGDPSTGMPFQTLGGIFGMFKSPVAPAAFAPTTTLGGFLGFNASGTTGWRGGLSWVGEQGPELLDLPAGSRVLPKSAWGSVDGGGGDYLELSVGVDGDSLGVYVEKSSRKVAMEETAKGSQKAIRHYRNTGFHDDFEKHAKNRRHRGGKGS